MMKQHEDAFEQRCQCPEISVMKREQELRRVMGRRLNADCRPAPFDPPEQWDVLAFKKGAENELQCLCTQHIQNYHIIHHVPSGVIFAVGAVCVNRYFPAEVSAVARHMKNEYNKAACAVPACPNKIDKRTTAGKQGFCSEACVRSDWRRCDGCSTPLDPASHAPTHRRCRSCYARQRAQAEPRACDRCHRVVALERWQSKCLTCYRATQ